MKCPHCGSADLDVKDSRPGETENCIRRRRQCGTCGGRYTTYERISVRELTVKKRSGRVVPFDQDRIMRSIVRTYGKIPLEATPEAILEQVLQQVGERAPGANGHRRTTVPSAEIATAVMTALRAVSPCAYVRYASVFRGVGSLADFRALIEETEVSCG